MTDYKIYTHDQLREALKDRNISQVARSIGVSANTLYTFMKGSNNPSSLVVDKLREYING